MPIAAVLGVALLGSGNDFLTKGSGTYRATHYHARERPFGR